MANLRFRLCLLFVLSLVPFVGLNLYAVVQARRELEKEALESTRRLAELVAANQELHLEYSYQLLLTIAQLSEGQSRNGMHCGKAIVNLMAPPYANLGVIDRNQRVACSGVALPGADMSPQLRPALASEEEGLVVGGSQILRGKPVLNVFYVPGDKREAMAALAFVALDLMWLNHAAASQLPPGSSFGLIDDRGTLLVGSPAAEKLLVTHKATIQELLKHSNGAASRRFQTGRSLHAVAFAPVRGFRGQKLFVMIENARRQPVFASVLAPTLGTTTLLVLALVVSAGVWRAADYLIVGNIRRLRRTARRLSAGELTARARVSSDRGELTELARSVNGLADTLQRSETEAKAASQNADRQRARQSALQEINLAITSTLDLTTILNGLLEKIDLLLPYSAATVRLYDAATGRLEPFASRNLDDNAWRGIPWRPRLGLANAVFDSNSPLIVPDAQIDARTMNPLFFRKQGIVSYLGVPLLAKGERLGVLSFYTKYEHRFSPDEVDFLTALAGQAAVAIQNSRLFERTHQQAIELDKANTIKNEFLAVMSHELRTPLNIIMNFTDLLKGKLLGDFSEAQEKALDKVSRQARELLYMIDKILEVAQLQAGSVSVEKRKLDLPDLLGGLKAAYGEALKKDVEVRWQVPEGLPVIETDAVKLRHILTQLIENAIKFTDRGSVVVTAHAIAAEREKGVEFVIEDTGIGIPEECFPRIFEQFRQNDASDTRPYGGIGVGLYLVKTYAALIGGDVSVESKPGRGSTFRVRLPMQQV